MDVCYDKASPIQLYARLFTVKRILSYRLFERPSFAVTVTSLPRILVGKRVCCIL